MTSHDVVELDDAASTKLFRWNIGTALFHLLTSCVIFGITDRQAVVPIFTTYASSRDDAGGWQPVPEKQSNSIIGYYSGVFLLLAAIDHFLVATLLREQYEGFLRKAQNPFRWIEYSISASVMRLEIAQLSGILDAHLLVAQFGLTMTTMLLGWIQEVQTWRLQGQPEKKTLLPFWVGFVPHAFSWGIISSYFFQAVSTGDPPDFVWAIIFILFFLDLTFAINMFLQQKEVGRWSQYLHGEFVFLILSLTAKQLLAWINYGGGQALRD
eukprot:m.125041 g.125041  ORF g.125041 m.125041 type:complete len:268 (+) comp15608_c1_seq1:82-885(+)